jgi:xanthosine phosphorylase
VSFENHNVTLIRKQLPANFNPKIAIILGSGLGAFTENLTEKTVIPYAQLTGFDATEQLAGHHRQLVAGFCDGVPVVCLEGRFHYYEGISNQAIQILVRTVKALGCEKLLITNAAGSLLPEVSPASLVTVKDHINFLFHNPLTGTNNDDFGPRFVDMSECYDKKLRQIIEKASQSLDIKYQEGVYVAVLGPSFETPAEIRAFRILGADLVGMSTVPEAIVARHCQLRVAAISVVTNFAAGMSSVELSHEQTLACAQEASGNLCRLLKKSIELFDKEN